jgi:hypothetical protein
VAPPVVSPKAHRFKLVGIFHFAMAAAAAKRRICFSFVTERRERVN